MRKLEVTIDYLFTKTFESDAKNETNNLMAATQELYERHLFLSNLSFFCSFINNYPTVKIQAAINIHFPKVQVVIHKEAENRTRYEMPYVTIVETIL